MTEKNNHKNHGPQTMARLAAVQALYRASFQEQPLADIVKETVDQGFSPLFDEDVSPAGDLMPDAALFAAIAEGVSLNEGDLDAILTGALDSRLTLSRMEVLLRAILRAGVFELLHHPDVPAGALINDYVDVTRAFFQAKEPGLVNAVLDKLAKKLRS